MIRTGLGIDMHPFADKGPLVLGGATIASERGLSGLFDADVLAHAICDSLLGAAGLGEIREMFPENDPKYSALKGLKVLELVRIRLSKAEYYIENIDVTLICPEIDISQYKTIMALNIAHALEIEKGQISIKSSECFPGINPDSALGITALAISTLIEYESEEEPEEYDSPAEEYYE